MNNQQATKFSIMKALISHGRYNLVATQTIPNRGKKTNKNNFSKCLSQSKLYLVYNNGILKHQPPDFSSVLVLVVEPDLDSSPIKVISS